MASVGPGRRCGNVALYLLLRSPESLKHLLAAAGQVALKLTVAALDEMFPEAARPAT